jgi:hypothetical protein
MADGALPFVYDLPIERVSLTYNAAVQCLLSFCSHFCQVSRARETARVCVR